MILIRHAHAGNKANWHREDDLRPLTGRGLVQAGALITSLADDEVTAAWSSPALRCVQTITPLAAARGVPVRDNALLAKNAPVDDLLTWMLANRSEPWALCTHGEVLHALLDAARASGLVSVPARVTEKGAAWRVRLHPEGTALEYLPPLLLR